MIVDPHCDPKSPQVVKLDRIKDAQKRIRGNVVRTPCTKSESLSKSFNMDLRFKKEFLQYTGSFKDRGALYALLNLSEEEKRRGVITTSAGNHAQALAYQGSKLRIPVSVVMPESTPKTKVEGCKKFDKTTVILRGDHFDEARKHAMELGRDENLIYINGYDHPHILAGQGTIGLEILEDFPDVEYILVGIGGGGLIAGISAAAKAINPNVKIIGIESERCPSWHTAVAEGHPIPCKKSQVGAKNSITDGLSVIEVGFNSYVTAQIDELLTISESDVPLAILRLLEVEKSVVEGAGASGLAAIMSGKLNHLKGKKVACVLCGGNIDVNVLGRVIERGLMMDGRLCRFNCVISDRPGGLAKLLDIVAKAGANILEVTHDRASLPGLVYKTIVCCTVETRNREHLEELHQELESEYGDDLKW